eukprot:scaffold487784_cov44-Prasinocladus_malaysianus.AAC.2
MSEAKVGSNNNGSPETMELGESPASPEVASWPHGNSCPNIDSCLLTAHTHEGSLSEKSDVLVATEEFLAIFTDYGLHRSK